MAAKREAWAELVAMLAADSPDIVVVTAADGRIQHLSPPGERLFGRTIAELRGTHVQTLICDEDYPIAFRAHVGALKGEAGELVQYRVRAADGRWRWLELAKQALRDPATGLPHAVLAIARDIGARRQLERRYVESAARLDLAQRLARMGSWEISLEGGETHWSDGLFELLGYAPGAIRPSYEAALALVYAEDQAKVEAAMARFETEGEGLEIGYQLRFRRADGQERLLDCLSAHLVHPERGHVVVGVAQDVTETEAAERARRAFLQNVSHELRTPLNAIIGYSEMLIEEDGDAEPQQLAGDLARIRDAGHHLLALVDELLNHAAAPGGERLAG